jgi:hypothetical protein
MNLLYALDEIVNVNFISIYDSCSMLTIEKMLRKSLTHHMHCVNKIKGYFNFHINYLKLLKKKKVPNYIHKGTT